MLAPPFPSKRQQRESNETKANVSRRGVQEPEIHSANDMISYNTYSVALIGPLIDWSHLAPTLQYSASEKESRRFCNNFPEAEVIPEPM